MHHCVLYLIRNFCLQNGLLLGAPGIYLCSGGTMEYDNDFISPIVTTQLNNAFNQLHANAFMGIILFYFSV